MSTLERLGQTFFLTYNDVSKGTGDQHAPDINVRQLNVCVRDPRFSFRGENAYVSKYNNMSEQKTIQSVQLSRRIGFRQLGKKVRIVKFCSVIGLCAHCQPCPCHTQFKDRNICAS